MLDAVSFSIAFPCGFRYNFSAWQTNNVAFVFALPVINRKPVRTHTLTHTYIHIYIYIQKRKAPEGESFSEPKKGNEERERERET